jgi:hypothetical protein
MSNKLGSKKVFIKITCKNEEIKKIITSFVFSNIPLIERDNYISVLINDIDPNYVEILNKIPELLQLDSLVEISNHLTIDTSCNENNQYLLPLVDSFISECSEQSKKRYFEDFEEKLIKPKKPKTDHVEDYRKNKYLDKRDYFIKKYLSETDYLINNRVIKIGEKYDLYKELKENEDFNKNFYYFYSSSPKSRDYLHKLGIDETPMDIIKAEIKERYKDRFICISEVHNNGYVNSKVERVR